MPVVQVRVMDVRVPHRGVAMPVRVRLGHGAGMAVLMVRVMHMPVRVLQHRMRVFVHVAFGEVQP